jgi:putative endopeptidase
VWLEKGSLQQAYNQINDPHPMGYLRVNGTLQQFDEFLNFYGITEGDGMYLAPEDRVAIW